MFAEQTVDSDPSLSIATGRFSPHDGHPGGGPATPETDLRYYANEKLVQLIVEYSRHFDKLTAMFDCISLTFCQSQLTQTAITSSATMLNVRSTASLIQESPAVTREDAIQPIQLPLQYWPSSSSKVNDFHVIWKSICDLLLMINSNSGPISHHLATIHPWRTYRQTGRRTTIVSYTPTA